MIVANDQAYEAMLLESWEDLYRKSQLGLLILLALKEGPKYTAQVSQFIKTVSGGLQTTDDQSIYRALRRFNAAAMIHHEEIASMAGPNKKVYSLSDVGARVLAQFLTRNVIHFFYDPSIRNLIERN